MIDLVIHAGTKFALEQWLDARGLGDNVQDTDATSPTFGQYVYSHTHPASTFIYWRHPSGKLEATSSTFFTGFYGILRFLTVEDMEATIAPWVRTSTATSILDSFNGIGGEGVTLIAPEDVNAHCDTIGVPRHEFLGGMEWSDPRVWYLSPVMIGDQIDFEGTTYRSTIDFNVWSPTQYPAGWTTIGPVDPGTQEWAAGVAYAVNDEVTYQGSTYRCLQAHTSQAGWTPTAVPALWQAV